MTTAPPHRAPSNPVFALRIASLYARSPYAARTNTALAVLALVVMWGRTATALLLFWFVCVIVNNLISLRLHYAARSLATDCDTDGDGVNHAPQRWATYATRWMLCSGLLWGGGALLMFPVNQPLLQAFWLVLINGLAAGVVAANAFHRPAQLAYLIPLLVPLTLRLVVEGGFEYHAIALGMALFFAFCVVQGGHQTRLIEESFAMRFENQRLVDELREQTHQADRARAVAEHAVQDKARFFAAASHDLRQPLHALGLFTAALHQTAPTAAQIPLIERMESGIGALEELFHALLDISRLDAGAVQVQAQAVSLHALSASARANHEASALHKGLQFAVLGAAGFEAAAVHADPVLLHRMLGNLLENAIHYTPKGRVALCFRREQGLLAQWRIEVRDSGIGIDPTDHAVIFDEFTQLGNPGRDRRQGSGLGLATVRRLAALSGTQIVVRSARGRGALFSLTLPAFVPVEHSLSAQMDESIPSTKIATSAAFSAAGDPLVGARIAVIDDEALVQEGVAVLLRSWGAVPLCAVHSGAWLADFAEQQAPDVLLTDWMLGVEDGFAAAARLQAAYPGLPTILATADSAPERRALAQAHNLTLLVKPFQPAKLRATLNALLAQRAGQVPEEARP